MYKNGLFLLSLIFLISYYVPAGAGTIQIAEDENGVLVIGQKGPRKYKSQKPIPRRPVNIKRNAEHQAILLIQADIAVAITNPILKPIP